MSYPLTIAEAAKRLDKEKPGWEGKININTLDMTNYRLCILGQLYGEYDIGQRTLFGGPYPSITTQDVIFGDNVDTSQWIKEIDARKGFDFYTALKLMHEGKKVQCTDKDGKNRILCKYGDKIIDASESDCSGANPCIFVFMDKKFKLYNPLTFENVKVGQKFTLKSTKAKFIKIRPVLDSNTSYTKPSLNVVNLTSYHAGLLLDSDEVTDITN
jgi:hypothetical protein